ncbi:MAG TPA: hypothetical protein VGJ28_05785 [Micromonosporaceae bacterium]|jgi:hypothetical protein
MSQPFQSQYVQDPSDYEAASVPFQPLPFAEPYRLARDQVPETDPYEQPFLMEPGAPRRTRSRWLIAAAVLCSVLVLACVGAFTVLGLGAKSVSDKITRNQQAAAKDVQLARCARDANTGVMTASVVITNHGGDSASYVVDVAFTSADGRSQLDTGVAATSGLSAGRSATVVARGASTGPAGFGCNIIDATRF